MIVIRGVGSYLPEGVESNLAKAEAFDVTPEFIIDKLGVEQVTRMADGQDTSDLCVEAFRDLKNIPEHIDCLVVCTQNPDANGLPHTSAIVHGKLGLNEDCAAFDISLGCSGYVYGLSIVSAFMQANGMRHGLLFTADPYSKILDPADRNTSLLFGDGATVTLLESCTEKSGAWVADRFLFNTAGQQGDALNCDSGCLHMNGRAVFNFAMQRVPGQIEALLEQASIDKQAIDAYLFHQGSRFIVENLARRLGLDPSRVPLGLARSGNTVSSSIPMLLQQELDKAGSKLLLLSGFGVGLSWASCILKRY